MTIAAVSALTYILNPTDGYGQPSRDVTSSSDSSDDNSLLRLGNIIEKSKFSSRNETLISDCYYDKARYSSGATVNMPNGIKSCIGPYRE